LSSPYAFSALSLHDALPIFSLAVCASCQWGSLARGQVSPTESAKKIKPAEGLEAVLWASEPMVKNPTNLDVDSRGRVWVTEGLKDRKSTRLNSSHRTISYAV